ncbi:MAG: hypothetical protein M3071_19610 [Actinomycetota bacterium]|nr:hypothetical protein [Actinomycetota bacterium]
MTKRIQGMLVAFAAIAAMAFGGAVFASAQTTHTTAHEKVAAIDKDNVQSGDQKAPDTTTKATELPGVETTTETSSETGPSDGPGGHADAPGATVDHQFQGAE